VIGDAATVSNGRAMTALLAVARKVPARLAR
jgi:hypothetical protein